MRDVRVAAHGSDGTHENVQAEKSRVGARQCIIFESDSLWKDSSVISFKQSWIIEKLLLAMTVNERRLGFGR